MTHPHPAAVKKKGRHNFQARRFMPWLMCMKCGLVLLRNKRTEKARGQPCKDE